METLTKTIWNVDKDHSEITFKVKHMMISTVTGHFDDFTITVEADDDTFNDASIRFSAKTASINTKNEQRDAHLKSNDFFNAEEHSDLTFASKSFDGETLIGDLTIKGVTREVKLATEFNGVAVDPYGQTKAGFELSGELNRKDFGLTWNAVTEAGNIVVSDTVKLQLAVQLIKA